MKFKFTAQDRYAFSILDVCAELHRHVTTDYSAAPAARLDDEAVELRRDYLRWRLDNWSATDNVVLYDETVRALMNVTLDELARYSAR